MNEPTGDELVREARTAGRTARRRGQTSTAADHPAIKAMETDLQPGMTMQDLYRAFDTGYAGGR